MKSLLTIIALLAIATDAAGAQPILRTARCTSFRSGRLIRFPVVFPNRPRAGAPSNNSSSPPVEHLFNGRDLAGWTVLDNYDFARHGQVTVKEGAIILDAGTPATGIRVSGDFPRLNYEVTLDTKRIEGSDFFCGLTFPVGDDYLSLILGGWGGGTTGISNLDNLSAIENETTGFQEFEQDRWYRVRLRVTNEKLDAWIDGDHIVEVEHKEHKLSIWWEQEPVRPFGIASWYTKSAIRDIRLKRL